MKIKTIKTLLVVLCACISLPAAAQIDPLANKKFRVVVFGDSLTSGYEGQLADSFSAKLQRKIRGAGFDNIEVINLGKPSESSSSAIEHLSEIEPLFPDVIIIQLGFNDIKRGIPPSIISHNLHTIITKVKETGAYVILAGVGAPDEKGKSYQAAITDVYYKLGETHSIALYPNIVEYVAHNPSLTLADGVHPNSLGVDVMVDQMFPLVDTGLRWAFEVYQFKLQQQDQQIKIPVVPLPPQ